MLKPASPIHVQVGNVTFGNDLPLALIIGSDSLESMENAMYTADQLVRICGKLGISFVYKGCFDKSQRTSVDNWRGMGWLGRGDSSELTSLQRLEQALPIYQRIKDTFGVPVTTDFSKIEEAKMMSGIVDLYQIQARLYRITDDLVAASSYGPAVNIKRGQGEPPAGVKSAIGKVESTGNRNILLTERGSSFGHEDIVVDPRLLWQHHQYGYPVVLDASHPCQRPSAAGGKSGGDRTLSPPLARAGVGVGVAGIFMEVHRDPDNAPVDGPHSIRLDDLEKILLSLKELDEVTKRHLWR